MLTESRSQIGEYRVERALSAGRCWLAAGSHGRRVVLKAMESDCLLKGTLHPMIRDRLSRVRELAHLGVANLLGVERDEELVYCVWEYVDGATLDEYIGAAGRGPEELARIGHELVVSVETLHSLGIVHGSIHGRNVIVSEDGVVRLTHVSPLLYNDPEVDVEDVAAVLQEMGCIEPSTTDEERPPSLREMGVLLAAAGQKSRHGSRRAMEKAARRQAAIRKGDLRRAQRTRRTSIIAAILVAALGLAVVLVVWWMAREADAERRPSGASSGAVR